MTQESKPWELVADHRYFRKVLGNMTALGFGPKHDGKAYVRFGNTGGGIAPNYQIQGDDNAIHCFGGRNHQTSTDDEFETGHLSEERFTYRDVTAMLARLS